MDQPLTVVVDGVAINTGMHPPDQLVRAVMASLFTWRRAHADDPIDGDAYGWWADSWPVVDGDRIGSRLWLLSRRRLDDQVVGEARDYCIEALQWLLDDKVASTVEVWTAREGREALSIKTRITRSDGRISDLRFDDVWGFINAI
jgi:phage gp46-like protein